MNTGYTILKKYLRLFHDHLLLRGRQVVGGNRLPSAGESFFIACNHENTANDPLNIVFALPDNQRVGALARANVFYIHPLVTKFLRWLGLRPAFRAGWEGGDALDKNQESFRIIASEVNAGRPFIVFPGAGHSQGHYLPRFTTGLVRMAFSALEQNNWQKDVKIVPTSLFYDDYFALRADVMWTIGEPISLIGYREEYACHPYSVLRKVRNQMRREIASMTLDEGEADHEVVDFLRRSSLCGVTGATIAERFGKIQSFVSALRSSENYDGIIRLGTELRLKEQALGLRDGDDALLSGRHEGLKALCGIVVVICLLPLWIVSLWPNALCYYLPTLLLREDKMFTNSYRYIISVLLLYPLFAVITILAGIMLGHVWLSVLWVALWLPLSRFCWWYFKGLRLTVLRLRCIISKDKVKDILNLKNKIRKLLTP